MDESGLAGYICFEFLPMKSTVILPGVCVATYRLCTAPSTREMILCLFSIFVQHKIVFSIGGEAGILPLFRPRQAHGEEDAGAAAPEQRLRQECGRHGACRGMRCRGGCGMQRSSVMWRRLQRLSFRPGRRPWMLVRRPWYASSSPWAAWAAGG